MRLVPLALVLLASGAAWAQSGVLLLPPVNAPPDSGPAMNAPAGGGTAINAPPSAGSAAGAPAPAAAGAQGAGPAVSALAPGIYESVDIEGPVLRSFPMQQPRVELCAQACADDRACSAYTYVKPGGYSAGDPPMCVLKSRVDRTSINVRVTSGVLR